MTLYPLQWTGAEWRYTTKISESGMSMMGTSTCFKVGVVLIHITSIDLNIVEVERVELDAFTKWHRNGCEDLSPNLPDNARHSADMPRPGLPAIAPRI